jgi:hypothetical protein
MEISIRHIGNKAREAVLKPKDFWEDEKINPTNLKQVFVSFYLPLVLLAGIAEFAGQMLRGSGFYLMFPVMRAMREIILFLLLYIVSVFLSNLLIKAFGGEKNLAVVRKLVIFSLIPVLLVSIVTNLFPFLYVLDVAGFYSFFIFLAGVEEMLVFPERKRNRYILTTLMVNFFAFTFLSIFLSRLLTAVL